MEGAVDSKPGREEDSLPSRGPGSSSQLHGGLQPSMILILGQPTTASPDPVSTRHACPKYIHMLAKNIKYTRAHTHHTHTYIYHTQLLTLSTQQRLKQLVPQLVRETAEKHGMCPKHVLSAAAWPLALCFAEVTNVVTCGFPVPSWARLSC